MKIYDCFMFFDEEVVLDLRLNLMNKHVDRFVIAESTYMHSGKPKKLVFDINKFKKFKDKITYIVVNEQPPNILKIKDNDTKDEKEKKKTFNAAKRELFQINKTQDGLKDSNPDDVIIVSDVDEIPDLENVDLKKISQKLIFFKQKMFYYKLNLYNKNLPWYGSKACRKRNFKSPEWLRSIKNKKYSPWRMDILFSNLKYSDIYFVEKGGWHFTNIRTPEALEKKLLNFLHHVDFEQSGMNLEDLKKLVNEKRVMYNHTADKKSSKWGAGEKLEKLNIDDMPKYIKDNQKKYKLWLDL